MKEETSHGSIPMNGDPTGAEWKRLELAKSGAALRGLSALPGEFSLQAGLVGVPRFAVRIQRSITASKAAELLRSTPGRTPAPPTVVRRRKCRGATGGFGAILSRNVSSMRWLVLTVEKPVL